MKMHYLQHLNENQHVAVMWKAGPLLLLASPGSGKVATIIGRIARILEEGSSESYRILCLTFARMSAANLKARLSAIVPSAGDRVFVTTFQSFAVEMLRQHGSSLGLSPDFEIIDKLERVQIVKSILTGREDEFSLILSADRALYSLDNFFVNVTEPARIPESMGHSKISFQLQTLFSEYKSELLRLNSLDFSSILYFCNTLLDSRPRLAEHLRTVYRHIFVDDFQDTSAAQYRLLRALAPDRNANIFVAGDEDQMIYQWAGASTTRFADFARDYDIKTVQLLQNYRCPPEIIALANTLMGFNDERTHGKHTILAMKSASGTSPVRTRRFDSQDEEAKWIAQDISAKLENGIAPENIAVLGRSVRLVERVCETLKRLGISASVGRGKWDFESAPLRLLTYSLKLAAARTDEELGSMVVHALTDCTSAVIPLESLFGYAGQVNGDYVEGLKLLSENNNAIPALLRLALSALAKGDFWGFTQLALEYFDLVEANGDQGREEFTDYSTERKVWEQIMNDLGGAQIASQLPLPQFLQALALSNKSPASLSNAIHCLTIHSSQGMEFPHVYLLGLAEDHFPAFQSKRNGQNNREIQDERRYCFVAITRATETLTLTYACKYHGRTNKPSQFLYEMGILS